MSREGVTAEDIELVRRLALGEMLTEISTNKSHLRALQKRVHGLRKQMGANTTPHLVYLYLSAYHLWPLNTDTVRPRPTVESLESIELMAHGYTDRLSSRKLHLTEAAILRRISLGKRVTRAKTRNHLVMICWSKDYIV